MTTACNKPGTVQRAHSRQYLINISFKEIFTTTPFPVSSFDGTSSRRSFELRSTPALRDFCVRMGAKLEPMGKQLHCNAYNSLLRPQKGDYEPLFRTKLTIDETGRSLTTFFEAGTKRRMSNAELQERPH